MDAGIARSLVGSGYVGVGSLFPLEIACEGFLQVRHNSESEIRSPSWDRRDWHSGPESLLIEHEDSDWILSTHVFVNPGIATPTCPANMEGPGDRRIAWVSHF